MTVKLFIEDDNTVTISCAHCEKTKTVDASRLKGHTKVRLKCTCGNFSTYQIEKRKQYRKKTDLRGTYRVIQTKTDPPNSGVMTVVNISKKGVRMKFSAFPWVDIGDIININVHLDDKNKSFIDRDVVVQNIEPPHIGAFFHRPHESDSAIGFYLFK